MIDIDRAFQQVWDFRRKEDNENDSMSEDSKPSSELAPLILTSPEKDHDDEETTQKIGNPSRAKIGSNKSSRNRAAAKRKKIIPDNDHPDLILSDFKKFTDSLIEDIKVARKKMLAQMKRQLAMMIAKPKPVQQAPPKRRKKAAPKTDTKANHQETGKKSSRRQTKTDQTQTKRKRSNNAKVQDTKKCPSNLPNDPCSTDEKQETTVLVEEPCLQSKEICTGTKGDFDITELFKRDDGSKDMAAPMESQTSSILQHWFSSNISGQAIMPECFDARSNMMMSYGSNINL